MNKVLAKSLAYWEQLIVVNFTNRTFPLLAKDLVHLTKIEFYRQHIFTIFFQVKTCLISGT